MIISKYNKLHIYTDLEPILDGDTSNATGDVMAIDRYGYRLHLKLSSLVGTTPEDEEQLKALGKPAE